MRAMWSGAITFGLIHIPVRIYSATKESLLSFDLLHKGDLSPIRYARMCKAEEKEVPYNEIVISEVILKTKLVLIIAATPIPMLFMFINYPHPTPSLGAFPLEKGKEWLQRLQKQIPRHFYRAPLGIIHGQNGFSKCYVGIRNVQWDETDMRIGVGCGVIQESHFEKEWA